MAIMAGLAVALALFRVAGAEAYSGGSDLQALPDDDGSEACADGQAGAGKCPSLSLRQLRGELLAVERHKTRDGNAHQEGGVAGLLEVLTVPADSSRSVNVTVDALLAQLAERLGATEREEGLYDVSCDRVEALPQLAVSAGDGRALALAGRDFVSRDAVGGCHLAARGFGCSICQSTVNALGIVGATGACMTACDKVIKSWSHFCGAVCAVIETGVCHHAGTSCAQLVCSKVGMCDSDE
mmetsp:Transcript_2334/g.7435  ORF Transcript_2334/g.7435 Transcript_2334/m.7435 type:complete len:240 (+) Transcript_2334:68-787(+)